MVCGRTEQYDELLTIYGSLTRKLNRINIVYLQLRLSSPCCMYLVPGPPYSPLFPAHFLLTGCLKEKIRFCMKDIVSPLNLLNMKTTLEIFKEIQSKYTLHYYFSHGIILRLILSHLLSPKVIFAFNSFWETLYYCTLKIATYIFTH